MDWGAIFGNAAVELISPTTAAYALAALGLAIHFGFTGLLNFGQAGFMLLGAYGYAIPALKLGWPFWACVLTALAASVIFALILGIPTLRLRADYLAIVTIAAAEVLRLVFTTNEFQAVTGSANGLSEFQADLLAAEPVPSRSLRLRTVHLRQPRLVLPRDRLDRPRDRRGLDLAHHAQPLGPRHQGHPRRRRRGASARQERVLLQDAEPHPRWPPRHHRRHHLRAATRRRAVVLPAVADLLRLRDPAARRRRDHPRADRRIDRVLGAALVLLGLHRPSGRGRLAAVHDAGAGRASCGSSSSGSRSC